MAIDTTDEQVISIHQYERRSGERYSNSRKHIHGTINQSLEFAQAYFDLQGVNGARKLVKGISTGISEMEHQVIDSLDPATAERVRTAINNGLAGDPIETGITPALSDFETKLTNLQLAGMALYLTPEGLATGVQIAGSYDYSTDGSGNVTVAEIPEPEE